MEQLTIRRVLGGLRAVDPGQQVEAVPHDLRRRDCELVEEIRNPWKREGEKLEASWSI